MANGDFTYPPTPRLRTVPLPPQEGRAPHSGAHAFCLHSLLSSGQLVYDASTRRFTTTTATRAPPMGKGTLDAVATHPALHTLRLRFARFPREWDVSVAGAGGAPITVAHILHVLPQARALAHAHGLWTVRLEYLAGEDFVVFLAPTSLTP